MSLDLSPAFFSTVHPTETFLANISLQDDRKAALQAAQMELRGGLRARLQSEVARLLNTIPERISPKFVTQGSVSYKTLNSPCRPPQQCDLDDGVYLPLSYVQDSGQPSQAAETMFEALGSCARQVAEENGWTLDETNPRCIRVIVSDDMHIDIPVYSIPDEEFHRLVEERQERVLAKKQWTPEELEDLEWDDVSSDRVLLATRNQGWLAKDPRPIRSWVLHAIESKGEQLRRVMRYLKAWRDFQPWSLGDDPKSILLMVAAEAAFEESIVRRDDLALLATVRGMPSVLKDSLPAPWDSSEDLAARLDDCPGLRSDVVGRLRQLADAIDFAINTAHTAGMACARMRSVFGDRFPDRPDLILMGAISGGNPSPTPSAGVVGRQNNA